DIAGELRAVGLPWIEDPSNRDDRFVRNRIRHHVLPALAATWGADVVDALHRVGARMRAVVEALDVGAAEALDRLGRVESHGIVLSRGALAALSGDVAANVLRLAAARLGSRAPLRAWAHRGLARVLRDPPARRPFRLDGVTVEVSGDWLRLSCEPQIELTTRVLEVPGRTELGEIDGAIE